MKTIFLAFGIVIMLIALLGADIRRKKEVRTPAPAKKPCYGYTIIEFGIGIDCYGDTVKLAKLKHGGQVLARE